jgi:hypothetical protein
VVDVDIQSIGGNQQLKELMKLITIHKKKSCQVICFLEGLTFSGISKKHLKSEMKELLSNE